MVKEIKSRNIHSKQGDYKKILLIVAFLMLLLITMVLIIIAIGKTVGKNSLYGNASSSGIVMDQFQEEEEIWEEGMVGYEGKLYAYNEDILTFLILGIDQQGEVEAAKDGISGGQSDAIFLAVCNPVEGKVEIIAVNRNTMTEIERYNEAGEFLWKETAQIAIQHGYGDGLEQSCERSVAAVSNLFYELPIHGYASINMGGITAINHAVGGVEVTVEEDIELGKYFFEAGETVLLEGDMAYWFLKYRDVTIFDSASDRLNRQKLYISSLLSQMIGVLEQDGSIVGRVYEIAKEYIVTDISLEEMAYMATTMSKYEFHLGNMHSLEGETITGEMYEEFYVDTQAMYELILDVFYLEVEVEVEG